MTFNQVTAVSSLLHQTSVSPPELAQMTCSGRSRGRAGRQRVARKSDDVSHNKQARARQKYRAGNDCSSISTGKAFDGI